MSIYTTPLQFAYFLALLFAILLLVRGLQEERHSDKLLASVMFMLAMEIQDYTFGFSGINFLWEELNGFPRYFSLAFAPSVYFYLLAQINQEFKFTYRFWWHYVPYAVYFITNLTIFLQGAEAVHQWQKSAWIAYAWRFEAFAIWVSYGYYFYKSLKIYQEYREWTKTQFSDIQSISFSWLRNFIYLIIAGEVFKWIWFLIDVVVDLPYEKDWWWHLFTVVIICYVGIKGYTQVQNKRLFFMEENIDTKVSKAQPNNNDYVEWKPKIERLFVEEKLFLEPELTLNELAMKLKTNTSVISAAINQNFQKNFNDFVNEYRVEEFIKRVQYPENKHLTLLAIAFDCGFNSKATFNRAFKKFTGKSPKELL